jgi:hypothetical protein
VKALRVRFSLTHHAHTNRWYHHHHTSYIHPLYGMVVPPAWYSYTAMVWFGMVWYPTIPPQCTPTQYILALPLLEQIQHNQLLSICTVYVCRTACVSKKFRLLTILASLLSTKSLSPPTAFFQFPRRQMKVDSLQSELQMSKSKTV